ncbi:hypothetical protein QQF64_000405 [Cirrhinus molitorella]|uniref:Uncharacterized protein n=1 Tax=Cirrhinus molitorella TaxID=172907 RepID=A0ABR3NXN1_9TELE
MGASSSVQDVTAVVYSAWCGFCSVLSPQPKSLLEAELRALQREVFSLHRAREHLSQQLSVMWRREGAHVHTYTLETRKCELQEQSGRLETLFREKTRQSDRPTVKDAGGSRRL